MPRLEPGTLYSIEQLSEVLGVSVRTIQRAVKRGDLVARRLGRKMYFRTADVVDGLPVYASKAMQDANGQGA